MSIENPFQQSSEVSGEKQEEKDFEVEVMKGLSNVELPDSHKEEQKEWNSRISEASSDELPTMILEAAGMSYKEEELAREFVRRGIDVQEFLETAKFRTTKAILEGKLKE